MRYEDWLQHHGILGQKWGKRNGPPYPLSASSHSASEKKAGWRKSLDKSAPEKKSSSGSSSSPETKTKSGMTEEQKKRFKKIVVSATAAVGLSAAVYIAYRTGAVEKIQDLIKNGVTKKSKYQDAMYETLDESTMLLRSGTIFHRMEGYEGLDVTKRDAPTFASFTESDRAKYQSILADFHRTGKRYDVSYEALKDIKVATKQKAEQIFSDLFNSDPKIRDQINSTTVEIIRKRLPTLEKYSDEDILKYATNFSSPFEQMVYNFASGQDSVSQKFRERVLQAGFDAIEDYNDKDKLAEFPVILLDPASTVSKKGEQFVDKALKQKTLKNLLVRGKKLWIAPTGQKIDLDIEALIEAASDNLPSA